MNKYLRSICFSLCISCVPVLSHGQCTSFPVVNLGSDTTICDTSFALDAGNAGMDFLWSTSDTTQFIAANSTGAYSVIVTDSLGCSTSDTINLVFNPPSVAGIISLAGGDTILCGNEATLFNSTGHTGYVLWWVMDTINWVWAPFGSGDTLDYGLSPNNMTGSYLIMATTTNGNCPPDTANLLNVALHTSPEVNLLPDDTICGYNVFFWSGYVNEQTLWSTGDTIANCNIQSTGWYWCTVTFQNGCADTDSAYMVVYPPASATWVSSLDTLCITDAPVLINPGSPAGGVFSGPGVNNGYFDGSDSAGIYFVNYMFTDSNGCVINVYDSIFVDNCIGINETSAQNQLAIYPNPAVRQITINLFPGANLIEIFDMQGRIIKTVPNSNNEKEITVDVSELEEGVYVIKVSGRTELQHSVFTVQQAQ